MMHAYLFVSSGPIHCQVCDAEWGVMLRYQSKEMPCIKASCFAFEFQDETGAIEKCTFKKWKHVRFHVEDFDLCEEQALDCYLELPELCLD